MQVNLVHPPFTFPSSPPLGISYLKSYLKKNNPEETVNCLDLNLRFHELVYNTAEIKTPKTKKDLEFLKTKEFFRTRTPDFFNAREYHKNAALFKQIFESFYNRYNMLFKDLLKGEKKQRVDLLRTLVRIILKNKPDVVGISVSYIGQWYISLLLGMLIKSLSNAKVVFGGSFLAVDAEKKFTKYAMDYLIRGEGEIALSKLLKNPDKPEQIPGLIYEKDEKIIENKPEPLKELDELPFPDYDDFRLEDYYSPEKVMPMLSSRGCYWQKCAFCSHYKSYALYRTRSTQNIIEEIKQMAKKGFRYFYFVDEHLPAKKFQEISKELINNKLKIRYLALAKPTKDFTPEITSQMYKAGCRMLIWGVESGCQRMLDIMNKGTTIKGIETALKNSAEAGIRNHIYIMVGFPSETEEEFRESLKFYYNNLNYIHSIHKGTFTLCKGSPVFENPKKYGVLKINELDKTRTSYPYEVKKGISRERKRELFLKNLRFFDSFNPFSYYLNTFRENAVIIYSELKDLQDNKREVRLE